VAAPEAGEARPTRLEVDGDRRAGVVAGQFPELPLAGEEPERVRDLGSEPRIEIGAARTGDEPIPGGDTSGH